MHSFVSRLVLLSLLVLPFGMALPASAAVLPAWNTSGSYVLAMKYLGTDYPHDVTLAQDALGAVTGSGGSPTGSSTYTWVITSGTVAGDVLEFYANYTATADAVTPLTVMHVVATVASDGTLSGTWSDTYQGGSRSGTLMSTSGTATAIATATPAAALAAEDFGVVSYDTGIGMLKGYTAGFGLVNTTFADAQSVVMKLYSGATLLQTNTSKAKVAADITGAQISSPFDVSGTFNYATDGYWTNVRGSEYGRTLPATKVVATVTLKNGTVLTAENTALVGDPATIFGSTTPPATTTPTTTPTTKSQCKNGGWMTFNTPTFQNQGQCEKFVKKQNNGNGNGNDDDDGYGNGHGNSGSHYHAPKVKKYWKHFSKKYSKYSDRDGHRTVNRR